MEEKRALQGLKRREEAALEWFIRQYAPYVSTIIFNILGGVGSSGDMEEVASDVFLALWKNAQSVRPGKARAYLSGIARNMAKDRLRKLGQELPLEEDILAASPMDVEHTLELREQARLVQRAMARMPHPDREIFLRHYYYGQPLSRVAEEMEMNLSTVKTRLRRDREKLKDELRKGGYDIDTENI